MLSLLPSLFVLALATGIQGLHSVEEAVTGFHERLGALLGLPHPLLAFAGGEYFPGLASSTFVAIASVWLWFRLKSATRTREILAV